MKTYIRKRQEHQEIESVLELCRLCLGKTVEGVPIFRDAQDVCAAVAMRIMICVGLEMKQDNSLPNMICMNCFEELEKYYKFRRKCEVSYHKLKSHLLALKYKEHQGIKVEVPVDDNNKPVVETTETGTLQVLQVSEENTEKVLELFDERLSQASEPAALKAVEMEEVQIPIQTETNPDVGTFLSTILTELGILVRHNDGIVLQDHGISSFELETGDNEQLILELLEEDDQDVPTQKIPIVNAYQEEVEQTGPEIKEHTVVFIDEKSKQNNKKGASKVTGPWCSVCGRVFSSRSAAARHARAHAGARPHACVTCRRTFAQKAVRDRHMLVHLDVRPHRCPQCDKSFTQRGALAAHARAHAAAAAAAGVRARPLALHRCTLCDKVFLYASGLSRHMMTHAGRVFECSACDKQFKDRSSLLRHLRHFYHDKAHSKGASTD